MNFWENKKVTVTGGRGFLGSYIIEKLKQSGCKYISIANRPEYDLTILHDIQKMYQNQSPDIVIHLAAVVGGIGANRENPAKYYYENRKHNGEQILNVLQGENKGALEYWYQKISQYEFDGWAYGGITNLNPDGELAMEAKFATGLLVLFQNKEFEKEKCKRLHLFGIGSIKYMIYFQYIQMLLNDMGLDIQITYDTSTYGFVAKNGVYWLGKNENDSMIGKTISNRNDYAPSKEFRLPCIYDCPVCASVENVEEYFMELDKDGDRKTSKLTRISTLHNLYVQKRVEQETRNILSSRCFTTYKVFFSGHTALNLERLSNIFGKTRDRGEEARKLLIAVFGEEEVV